MEFGVQPKMKSSVEEKLKKCPGPAPRTLSKGGVGKQGGIPCAEKGGSRESSDGALSRSK